MVIEVKYMSSIASIDTNLIPGLVQSFNPPAPPTAPPVSHIPTEDSSDVESSKVDLSSYYSNIRPEDLVANAGSNLVKSAQDMDKAMVAALQSGMSVNDVVTIKLLKLLTKRMQQYSMQHLSWKFRYSFRKTLRLDTPNNSA